MRAGIVGAVASSGGAGSGEFNGATGWTDFSEQDDWANPVADWTPRYAAVNTHATTLQRHEIIHGRSISGKMLLIDNHMDGFNGEYRGVVTWDVPGLLAAGDVELLILMRGWSNNQHGLGLSAGDAPSGGLYTPPVMQGIHVGSWNSNPRLRDYQKAAAANSWGANTFTDAGAGAAITSNKRYFIRFRRTSTKRWRAKIWDADLAEPSSWQHDANPDASFVDAFAAHPGLMLANWVGATSTDPFLVEYFSVSTNPDSQPAPMPVSLSLTGGWYGSVDFATATIANGTGFQLRRMVNSDTSIALEARVGSKHGTVLKITAPAASRRGFVTWDPAKNLYNGDVLALVECASTTTVLGAGVSYPRVANGSGFYDMAHHSYAALRDFANAAAWMGTKASGTNTDFGLLQNVTPVAIATTEKWWLRHRRTMHAIQCRWWKDGTAEPGAWNVDLTSRRDIDVVGTPGIAFDFGSAAGSVYVEHLAWTDDYTANPVDPI